MPSELDVMNAEAMTDIIAMQLGKCLVLASQSDFCYRTFMMGLVAINRSLNELENKLNNKEIANNG